MKAAPDENTQAFLRGVQGAQMFEPLAVKSVGGTGRDEARGRRPAHVDGHWLRAVTAELDVDKAASCVARGAPTALELIDALARHLLQHPHLAIRRVPHLEDECRSQLSC